MTSWYPQIREQVIGGCMLWSWAPSCCSYSDRLLADGWKFYDRGNLTVALLICTCRPWNGLRGIVECTLVEWNRPIHGDCDIHWTKKQGECALCSVRSDTLVGYRIYTVAGFACMITESGKKCCDTGLRPTTWCSIPQNLPQSASIARHARACLFGMVLKEWSWGTWLSFLHSRRSFYQICIMTRCSRMKKSVSSGRPKRSKCLICVTRCNRHAWAIEFALIV